MPSISKNTSLASRRCAMSIRHYPSMALVQVVRLVERSARVEIEATAVVRTDKGRPGDAVYYHQPPRGVTLGSTPARHRTGAAGKQVFWFHLFESFLSRTRYVPSTFDPLARASTLGACVADRSPLRRFECAGRLSQRRFETVQNALERLRVQNRLGHREPPDELRSRQTPSFNAKW
jgi:hypothetical protein